MKRLQRINRLADTDEFDRAARHRAHAERRTAASVAVHAGQHNARHVDPLLEAGGDVHGVLAGHGVGNKQGLGRLCDITYGHHFGHQFVVDMQSPGGIEHHDVETLKTARLHGAFGNGHRFFPGNYWQRGNAGLFTQHRELFHGGRAAGIERCQQYTLLVLLLQMQADLGA